MDNKVLFRGVGYDFIVDRLFQEGDEPKDNDIANRLFYFGEKAQHFRNENVDKNGLNIFQIMNRKLRTKFLIALII